MTQVGSDASRDEACYVYGIVLSDASLVRTAREGSAGDLELVDADEVAALVAMVGTTQPLGRSEVVAHMNVLNAVAASGKPVIPARLGSVLANRQLVVEQLLTPNKDRWLGLLDGLDGLSQFTIRGRYLIDPLLAEVVAEESEVAALKELVAGRPESESYSARVRLGELVSRAVDAKRTTDVQRVRAALEPFSASVRITPGGGLDGLADASVLVSADQRTGLERAAEQLADAMRERATFKLLGPLAPFEFVDEV